MAKPPPNQPPAKKLPPSPSKKPSAPKPSAPSVPKASSSPQFYQSGNILWDFRKQPNFVPISFIKIRNRSQAWYYKVTTLAMLVLIGFACYGTYLGWEYFKLTKQEEQLTVELADARRKERENQAKAKQLYEIVTGIEFKVGYDAIRHSVAEVLYSIARRIPADFYIQNLSLILEDSARDDSGNVVTSLTSRQTSQVIKSFISTASINGKIIGVNQDSTESRLVESFKDLPNFKILSAQSLQGGDGIDITFQYKSGLEFDFAPPPSILPASMLVPTVKTTRPSR